MRCNINLILFDFQSDYDMMLIYHI